jgi:CelD/BcsL family acetyltransferase involved in cellulose biosynthesis
MQTGQLRTIRINNITDLNPYRSAWRGLADETPMRTPLWLLSWWEYYGEPDDELCILIVTGPDDTLVGLAPLYIHMGGKRRTVRLLGSGDVCTNHSTWLAAPGWEAPVAEEVTRCLLQLQPGWDTVELDAVDADDVAINTSVERLAESGYLVRRTPRQSNWRITLPAAWKDYEMMLSRSQRKRCRKMQRRLLRSGEVKVHRVINESEFIKGFEIMLRLHATRWGSGNRPLGGFSDPRFHRFHRTVARELLRRKQLHLSWLEYEGAPIAAEYQFADRNAVYSYQAGMDPSITDFPPGNLSIMASLQFAIANGYETFDLASGDQPYKSNWRATATPCHDIRIWPATLTGRVQHFIWGVRDLAETVRMWLVRRVKALLPSRGIEAVRLLLSFVEGGRRGPHKGFTAG